MSARAKSPLRGAPAGARSPSGREGHGEAAGSAAFLRDLVTNTLDPGYAAAAARRGPGRRWYDRPLVALGCLLVGFTTVLGYVQTHRSAPQAARVHNALVARVRKAEADGTALAARAQQLTAQIDKLRGAALGGTGLPGSLTRDEMLAGVAAAGGPGLQVQLGDSPTVAATPGNARPGSVPINATQLLTDRDVRAVVNELWHDGAEAISINSVRLTPTSAVRFAGQAVLVDFQPITSPYTIRAIGDPDVLVTSFADSDVADRYQTLQSARGIVFRYAEARHLQLPASAAAVLRYARPGSSG